MPAFTCPGCGYINRPGARFCASCGNKLVFSDTAWIDQASSTKQVNATSISLFDLVILGCCLPITALLLGLCLPILNLSSHLLDAELYKSALRQENVYQRFPDLFAAQMAISQTALGKEAQIDFRGFTVEDWKLIAQELITPAWVQSQVEKLIDEIISAIKSHSEPPRMTISLAEVMQKLGGDPGFRIYKQVISNKRPCKLDDFFSMMDWMDEEPQAVLPICFIPPSLADFAAFFVGYENGDALIRDLMRDLPDQLPQEMALSDFFTLPVGQAGAFLQLLRALGWIGLSLAPLVLFASLLARPTRTLAGGLFLWGIALGMGGLLGLLVGFIAPRLFRDLLISGLRGVLTDALSGVMLTVSQTVLKPGAQQLTWQAGGLLFLGICISGIGGLIWMVQRKQSR